MNTKKTLFNIILVTVSIGISGSFFRLPGQ